MTGKQTGIQWTDETNNPIVPENGGWYCIKVSPGCKFCYAEKLNQNGFYKGNKLKYRVMASPPKLKLKTDMLAGWARQRKTRRHFVCSMTDLFGEFVPDEMTFQVLDAMVAAPMQTFQVLTKRATRVADLIYNWIVSREMYPALPANIWLGTSTENQEWFDRRVPHLLRASAQMKFLSIEPLLGPIDLHSSWRIGGQTCHNCKKFSWYDEDSHLCPHCGQTAVTKHHPIHWVIIGGESGPNARPMDLAWVRSIIAQCREAHVPVFVKQLGSVWAREAGARHPKGGDLEEWPVDLRVRMFPNEEYDEFFSQYGQMPDEPIIAGRRLKKLTDLT